jgi:DNA-binding NarL/FixJ family response regulator
MIDRMAWSVLIVDDDPAFRRLAARMLIAAGLTVAGEAGDARAAIAAANDSRPDAFLVDVGLPDRDGIDLAGELAALPWKPRVIVTSTDGEAADAMAGNGRPRLPFVAKEELPGAPLYALLGSY